MPRSLKVNAASRALTPAALPRQASTRRLLASRNVANPTLAIFIEVLTKCRYQLKLKFALPE
jgi:hypothetical protein